MCSYVCGYCMWLPAFSPCPTMFSKCNGLLKKKIHDFNVIPWTPSTIK